MNISLLQADEGHIILHLIVGFRKSLAQLQHTTTKFDREAAFHELQYYIESGFPIFIARVAADVVGYLVCRESDNTLWVESLYVSPRYRRQGIGAALYDQAEATMKKRGGETLYNWIHPTNDAIISFLRKRGYTVLNLIEVRRALKKEKIQHHITVGAHTFDYSSDE